jgi:hypothetical protein
MGCILVVPFCSMCTSVVEPVHVTWKPAPVRVLGVSDSFLSASSVRKLCSDGERTEWLSYTLLLAGLYG